MCYDGLLEIKTAKMFKVVPVLVLVAIATSAFAARIARSPGGTGWQGSSAYDSSPPVRSSGWNSGRSSGSNGWSGSGSGFGRNSGGSNGWGEPNGWGSGSAGSGFGRSSGSWGDSGSSRDWASGSGSNAYGSGLGSGLTSSIDFRSNGNGWQASW